MAQGKATEYFLTEKGLKFNQKDPRYVAEEKEIMDILKDGRLSIRRIADSVNKSLERTRTWEYIKSRLDCLEKEGLIKQKD